MSDPRALILDFGSVITCTLFEVHRQTERNLGLPPHTLTWMGPFASGEDLLWEAMERGDISQRDYWIQRAREVGALVGEEWTDMVQLVRRVQNNDPSSTIRPGVAPMLRAVRAQGIKTAILSNELDLFYGPEIRWQIDLFGLFDTIIDASYTHVLKPDPRSYLSCAQALGLPPADCLFIDDYDRNVIGAKDVGMHAIHLDVLDPALAFNTALAHLKVAHRFDGNAPHAGMGRPR